jgi:hypothetical protein
MANIKIVSATEARNKWFELFKLGKCLQWRSDD